VSSSAQFLNPSEAARRLGVSAKALRLYEQRGLITPIRRQKDDLLTVPKKWPAPPRSLPCASSASASVKWSGCLTVTRRDLSRLSRSRGIAGRPRPTTRRRHREGPPAAARPRQGRGVARRGAGATAGPAPNLSVVFKLPWPWGGERFELRDNRPLNYIIGPLGSGKTRLAKRISEALPDTAFPRLGPVGGRRGGGSRPTGCRPGSQFARRSDPRLARRGWWNGVGGLK
jgi:MerR family regulatory protein